MPKHNNKSEFEDQEESATMSPKCHVAFGDQDSEPRVSASIGCPEVEVPTEVLGGSHSAWMWLFEDYGPSVTIKSLAISIAHPLEEYRCLQKVYLAPGF